MYVSKLIFNFRVSVNISYIICNFYPHFLDYFKTTLSSDNSLENTFAKCVQFIQIIKMSNDTYASVCSFSRCYKLALNRNASKYFSYLIFKLYDDCKFEVDRNNFKLNN